MRDPISANLIEYYHVAICYEESKNQFEEKKKDFAKKYRIIDANCEKIRMELNRECEEHKAKWPVQRDLMQMNQHQQMRYIAERDAVIKRYNEEGAILQKKYHDCMVPLDNERKAIREIEKEIEANHAIITQRFHEQQQRIFEKFRAVAIDIAKSMNAVLFSKDQALYIDPVYDITKKVVDTLNKKYLNSNQKYNCHRRSCSACSNQDDTCSRNVKNCYAA